jgi:hypothetical protein
MRAAGRAWKTLSRSGSRNKLKSKVGLLTTELTCTACTDVGFCTVVSHDVGQPIRLGQRLYSSLPNENG